MSHSIPLGAVTFAGTLYPDVHAKIGSYPGGEVAIELYARKNGYMEYLGLATNWIPGLGSQEIGIRADLQDEMQRVGLVGPAKRINPSDFGDTAVSNSLPGKMQRPDDIAEARQDEIRTTGRQENKP
jgi:hypothetical protein